MGTRGLAGFRLNNKDYLFYNHLDSYPKGLGIEFLNFVKNMNSEKIRTMLTKAEIVENSNKGISSYDDFLEAYSNYKEKKLKLHLKNGFIKDSLFCEWAYIYDIDTKELEIYTGFNVIKVLQPERYAIEYNEFSPNYYACRLLTKISYNSFSKAEKILSQIDSNASRLYVLDDKIDEQKCMQVLAGFIKYVVERRNQGDSAFVEIEMLKNKVDPIKLNLYVEYPKEAELCKILVINKSLNCKKVIKLIDKIYKTIKNNHSIVVAYGKEAIELKPKFVKIKN